MFILLAVLAYIVGSIPSGLIFAKLFGLADPRTIGSGNIGATNLTRLGGIKLGALTLVADALKGALPTFMAVIFWPEERWVIVAVASAAVLGHCYSFLLRFKGGKGIATVAGTLLVLAPLPLLFSMIGWGLTFWRTRIASVAGIAASAVLVLVLIVSSAALPLLLYGIFASALILWRLRQNIRDLWNGSERAFR